MTVLPPLVLLITVFCVHSQVCHKDMSKNIQHGIRLYPPTLLSTITPIGPRQCAKECLKRTSCKSFNYAKSQLTCELNKRKASCVNDSNYLISASDYDYYDIGIWSKDLAGACVDHKCPENTKCIDLHDGKTTCVVSECIDPPPIKRASEPVGELAVGRHVVYSCSGSEHTITLMCIAGKWINNVTMTCPSKGIKPNCQENYDGCYSIFLAKKTYYETYNDCSKMYQCLIIIDSLETQLLQMSRFAELNITGNFWIYTYKNVKNKWITMPSLNPLPYFNWNSGEPSDGSCATMNVQTGMWSSAQCTDLNQFICQIL